MEDFTPANVSDGCNQCMILSFGEQPHEKLLEVAIASFEFSQFPVSTKEDSRLKYVWSGHTRLAKC